jgi:hypothetical protein
MIAAIARAASCTSAIVELIPVTAVIRGSKSGRLKMADCVEILRTEYMSSSAALVCSRTTFFSKNQGNCMHDAF